MKKRFFSGILLAMIVASGYAQNSALGNQMTAQQRSKLNIALLAKVNEVSMEQATASRTLAEPKLSILLEVEADADPVTVLQRHGVEPAAHIFQYASARVTLSQLMEMAADSQVVRMEQPGKVQPMLSRANPDTGVDRIHAGSGDDIHTPYTGKGVLALVEDTGFQPSHPMFINEDGKCKVEVLVDENGKEMTDQAEILAYKNPLDFHGTHVASILAGSKVVDTYGNNIVGAAPNVKLALFDTNMKTIDNCLMLLQKLADYAMSEANANRPKVLSFSIGTPSTVLSDGSGILASVMNRLAENWPVCVAAGNFGSETNERWMLLECTEKQNQVMVRANNNLDCMDPVSGNYYFVSYGDKPFDITISLVDDKTEEVKGKMEVRTDLNGKTECLSSVATDSDDEVMRNDYFTQNCPNARISYTSRTEKDKGRYVVNVNFHEVDLSANARVVFTVKGTPGQVIRAYGDREEGDIEETFVSPWKGDPSSKGVMTADGNTLEETLAPNVISVGSYCTGEGISNFSSYMTHVPSGALVPYICAPGVLEAAHNRWVNPPEAPIQIVGSEDLLVSQMGTSMATPYMAGVIALWLEANPKLTPADIKEIIAKTARRDEYVTSASEPARWGYGKVDAYAGLKEALNRAATSLTTISADKEFLWRKSGNQLEAYVAGETALTARLVNMEGKVVAEARQSGNTVTLVAPQSTKGVYVLQVLGEGKSRSHSAKVVIN